MRRLLPPTLHHDIRAQRLLIGEEIDERVDISPTTLALSTQDFYPMQALEFVEPERTK